MARYRKFLGAVGILAVAAFGTWGYLTGNVPSLIVAAVGLGLWLQALAMGDHKQLSKFLGAVGLLIVAILGPLTLFYFASGSPVAPILLAWTGSGFVLWSAIIAREAGLPYQVAAEWMIAFLALALGVGVVVALLAIVAVAVLGSGSGAFVSVALVAIASAWAVRHPRLAATLRALRRASLARASAEDSRLLMGGPRALLRPEPARASAASEHDR